MTENTAVILTKPILGLNFKHCLDLIGVWSLWLSLGGFKRDIVRKFAWQLDELIFSSLNRVSFEVGFVGFWRGVRRSVISFQF